MKFLIVKSPLPICKVSLEYAFLKINENKPSNSIWCIRFEFLGGVTIIAVITTVVLSHITQCPCHQLTFRSVASSRHGLLCNTTLFSSPESLSNYVIIISWVDNPTMKMYSSFQLIIITLIWRMTCNIYQPWGLGEGRLGVETPSPPQFELKMWAGPYRLYKMYARQSTTNNEYCMKSLVTC